MPAVSSSRSIAPAFSHRIGARASMTSSRSALPPSSASPDFRRPIWRHSRQWRRHWSSPSTSADERRCCWAERRRWLFEPARDWLQLILSSGPTPWRRLTASANCSWTPAAAADAAWHWNLADGGATARRRCCCSSNFGYPTLRLLLLRPLMLWTSAASGWDPGATMTPSFSSLLQSSHWPSRDCSSTPACLLSECVKKTSHRLCNAASYEINQ